MRETTFVKLDEEILDVGTIVLVDDVPLLSRAVCFDGSGGFYVKLNSKLEHHYILNENLFDSPMFAYCGSSEQSIAPS